MKQSFILWLMLGLLPVGSVARNGGETHVEVSCDTILKRNVKRGAASANLCWLLDSDLKNPNAHRSMKEAFGDLGVGSLRFPYGHLADNYLWHAGDGDAQEGLQPRVASVRQQPASWEWAVNPDGSFPKGMDFDEYMSLCRSLQIEPLVVVNALSYKYEQGPTLEQLAASAKAWVSYARSKNYKVAYWQIGNEVDHHGDLITKREYVDAYKQIARAMKEADPTIRVGPGILSKTGYFDLIEEEAPELMDFTSCHQYMWAHKDSCATYEDWLRIRRTFIPNVKGMQAAVEKSGRDLEIVVTETGVTGSGLKSNDVFASLWWFQVLMEELHTPQVSYVYFWGSHTPWQGGFDTEEDVGVLFRIDDNSPKPIAEVSRLVNRNLHANLLQVSCDNPLLEVYASGEEDCRAGSVFILNKSPREESVHVTMNGLPSSCTSVRWSGLYGVSPQARELQELPSKEVSIEEDQFTITLPAYSISVIRY